MRKDKQEKYEKSLHYLITDSRKITFCLEICVVYIFRTHLTTFTFYNFNISAIYRRISGLFDNF